MEGDSLLGILRDFFLHLYLGSVFLDPEDVVNLSIGAIWNFGNGTGLL